MSGHIKIVMLFLVGIFFVHGCATGTPGREKPLSPQGLRPGNHTFTIVNAAPKFAYLDAAHALLPKTH